MLCAGEAGTDERLGQALSSSWSLAIQLDFLAGRPQKPFSFCFHSTIIIDTCCWAWLFNMNSGPWTLVLTLAEQVFAFDWQSSPWFSTVDTYSALIYSVCAICHSPHYAICLKGEKKLFLLFNWRSGPLILFPPPLPPCLRTGNHYSLHVQMWTCRICFSMLRLFNTAFASSVLFVTKTKISLFLSLKFKPSFTVFCILLRQLAHLKSH